MINDRCGDGPGDARPSALDKARAHARVAGRIANRCAFAASMLGVLLLGYYGLVLAGELPPTPAGLVPIWATVILVLAGVKIVHWVVAAEALQTRAELAEARADIAETREAVRVALESITDLLGEAQDHADLRLLRNTQTDLDQQQRRSGNVRQLR